MSESNVVVLNMETRLPIPPDRVLEAASGQLERVVLVGLDKEGELYFAASWSDAPEMAWLMEKAKRFLLEQTK